MILLTLLATLTASHGASPVPAPTPETAALRVVDSFRADDIVALHALAADDIADAGAWAHADDVVDGLDCISVPDASVENVTSDGETAAVVELRIRGWGTTSGAVHVHREIVPRWLVRTVRVEGGWAVDAVRAWESKVVQELAALPDDAARRERLGRERDLSLSLVLTDLSDLGNATNRPELIDFTVAEALALGDPGLAAACLRNKAAYHLRTPPIEAAAAAAAEVLRLAEQSGEADRIAMAIHINAAVRWFSDDMESAATGYARAAAMLEQLTDPRIAHKARVMEGTMHRHMGDAAAGLASAFALEEQVRRYPWLEGTLNVHTAFALSLETLGYSSGIDHSRSAYDVARRLRKNGLIAMMATSVASDLLTRGGYAEALEVAQHALPKATRPIEKAALLLIIASAHDNLGASEAALAAIEQVLPATDGDTTIRAGALTFMAELHRRAGQLDLALRTIREARQVGATPGINRSATGTRNTIPMTVEGMILREMGRCDEAAAAFRDAIQLEESSRPSTSGSEARTRYLHRRGLPYLGLMEVLVDDGRIDDALRVSELFKGRALRDAFLSDEEVPADGVAAPGVQRVQALEEEIARLNMLYVSDDTDAERRRVVQEALHDAREELDLLRASVQTSRSKIGDVTQAGLVSDSLAQPELLLPFAGDVILDYVGNEDSTTLFIITRAESGLHVETRQIVIPWAQLEQKVAAFVKMVEARDLAYVTAAEELYRLLVAPAEQAIAGARTVAIIPDGPLWTLPFAALRDGRGRHLVERVPLFYAASLAMLASSSNRREPRQAESVLAIGDPVVSARTASVVRAVTGGLGPLPDAARESRSIASLYASSRVLIGAEATEETVKREAERHGILHFATHALEQSEQPLYSSIVLAQRPDAKEDGLLEAREVLELDLNAGLVVLSACSTGRGAVRWGEGVVGLAWAFFVAGTERMVVAQWPIDSAATADTMVEFHRALRRRGGATEAAAALRDAQLAIQRSGTYAHPYYWAPFAVIGDAWPRVRAPHKAGRRGDRPPAVRTRQQLH